jgi:hypothetical protein
MIRFDLSNALIHLTRDNELLNAQQVFEKILSDKKLLGSSKNIRGGHSCICFSETPISAIGQIIAQNDDKFHYGRFGFIFSKIDLFKIGARPVIYQPDSDYDLLPKELQYRHVRYELEKTDWTWEREWRIQTDSLSLDSDKVTLMVPDRKFTDDLKNKIHEGNISTNTSMGFKFIKYDKFEWHIIALSDLGYF